MLLLLAGSISAAQLLNNPIGADGCYIVKWDCATNSFASSNDFEADETFTFAVDVTGTSWVNWLSAVSTRGLCTNFSTNQGQVSRDGDRLYHIQGNIYGKTINLSQLSATTLSLTQGTVLTVYSNLFGFDATAGTWWQEPSDDITGNSDCFFRTVPYTGTKTGATFSTSQYPNIYTWINQAGYASPCANPGLAGGNQGGNQGTTDPIVPQDPPSEGSQVYLFPTDAKQHGYYNRPYQRYEAEPGHCTIGGPTATFLAQSDDQRDLQSEASHQQAAQLSSHGDYVEWVVDKPGDGLTIRFSLPDNAEGTGTTGWVDAYVGNENLSPIHLNSYWAWQYCDGNYPDNRPRSGNVVIRMRFDETHVRLSRKVQTGEVIRIYRNDEANGLPYTIDFIELEEVPQMVTFADVPGNNKVQFDGNGDVGDFIMNNAGKTIYLPAGTWQCDKRIKLENSNTHGTQIIGAGMWYTEIFFSASSDNLSTFDKRGIEAYSNNLVFEGLYLNTVNNKRYYNNDDSKQVGKGFMGAWGQNSVIRNCWVEHFECGAWFADYPNRGSNNLLVEHCRFRNNYADGVNCSHGIHGANIRYCSFRNNGDDDMASWSTFLMCQNVTYAYCTAENNWRASSLGFFGGTNHEAHHLYIVDALECGARVNADFAGAGFGTNDNTIHIHDVTIEHCGCKSGSKGQRGDFWGAQQGAFNIGGTSNYIVQNVTISDVTVRDSRYHAFQIKAQTGKPITNLKLTNILIDGAPGYGIYYAAAIGTASYCNIQYNNCTVGNECAHMPTYVITNTCDETELEELPFEENVMTINPALPCYDVLGRCVPCESKGIIIQNGHKWVK